MTLRAHHFVVTLLGGAIILSSLALLTVDPQSAQAACPTGSGVTITSPGSTASTTSLSGVVTLQAASTPITANGLTFMALMPAQQAIGEATQNGTQWTFSWDTRNLPNGANSILAIAHFGAATSLDCASASVPININNIATQAPGLQTRINPNNWSAPVGATGSFGLETIYTDQYGRQSHVSPASVNWHSPLGVAQPTNASPTVFKLQSIGSGSLIADISYNGINAQAVAPLKVTPPGSGTSGPAPTATPSPQPTATVSAPVAHSGEQLPAPTPFLVSATDAARLAAMPTIFRPADPTNTNPVVPIPTLSCLEKAVGSVRFAEISSGHSQPTAAERKLAASCFTGTERIPGVLAPVAPAHLTEVTLTKDIVTLSSVKNHTTTSSDGQKVKGLLIGGTGAPNSSVFVYVFSDPLVLRAQTNGSGVWNYVLESPLKAGKHEVYAVAEKDAGSFVRTSAVPITVAAAAQGSSDGSLVIENSLSSLQVGFAAGAGVLIVAAIGVLFIILRRRRRPRSNLPVASPPAMPEAPVPGAEFSASSPVSPTAPAAAVTEALAAAPASAPASSSADHDTQI